MSEWNEEFKSPLKSKLNDVLVNFRRLVELQKKQEEEKVVRLKQMVEAELKQKLKKQKNG